jgi:hypothetical protein
MDVYVTCISKSAVCCKNLLYSEKLKPAFAKNLNAFRKKLFLVIRKHFAKFCSLKSEQLSYLLALPLLTAASVQRLRSD